MFMKIIKIVSEKYMQNNYLVAGENDAVLIDASASIEQVKENLRISASNPKLRAILLTHEHFDHIFELDNLVNKFDCPVYIHAKGKPCLYKSSQNLSDIEEPFVIKEKKRIKTIKDGEEIKLEDFSIKAFHTPGHSLGSTCYLIEDNLFVGDTVFRVDVGRYDMYGGDANVQKITLQRLLTDESMHAEHYYAGHGSNFERDDLEYNINRVLGEN